MRLFTLVTATILTLFINTASAVTIYFDPTDSVVHTGNSVDIDLMISDLGAFSEPSLGSFTVDIAYDSSIISFNSVNYSDALGLISNGDADPFTTESTGSVTLSNFSFLSDTELDALQDSSFVLATLSFMGLAIGSSDLITDAIDFSNGVGDDITATIIANSGFVEVVTGEIPEPSSYLLMLFSIVLLSVQKRRNIQA